MCSSISKVYVVDDDIALCEALRWLLEPLHLVVETFSHPVAFLEAYQLDWNGCILLDIRMPELGGLQLQNKLIAKGNRLPIIMLSGHSDVAIAVMAMKAGAMDFITKPFSEQILLEQTQRAMQISYQQQSDYKIIKNYQLLTPREKEVMKGIVDGKKNKMIADNLNLSQKTVELHRSTLMRKMQAKNLVELVKMSLLIDLYLSKRI